MTHLPIPVFLNGKPVDATPGATLLDLVEAHDPALAALLRQGEAIATDGRGIAAAPDAPVPAGSIFRVYRSARGGPVADA